MSECLSKCNLSLCGNVCAKPRIGVVLQKGPWSSMDCDTAGDVTRTIPFFWD